MTHIYIRRTKAVKHTESHQETHFTHFSLVSVPTKTGLGESPVFTVTPDLTPATRMSTHLAAGR